MAKRSSPPPQLTQTPLPSKLLPCRASPSPLWGSAPSGRVLRAEPGSLSASPALAGNQDPSRALGKSTRPFCWPRVHKEAGALLKRLLRLGVTIQELQRTAQIDKRLPRSENPSAAEGRQTEFLVLQALGKALGPLPSRSNCGHAPVITLAIATLWL